MIYISRSFVEFGPFTSEEMQSFLTRGLLRETDFWLAEGQEDWRPIPAWENPPKPQKKATKAAKVVKAAPASALSEKAKVAPKKPIAKKKAKAAA